VFRRSWPRHRFVFVLERERCSAPRCTHSSVFIHKAAVVWQRWNSGTGWVGWGRGRGPPPHGRNPGPCHWQTSHSRQSSPVAPRKQTPLPAVRYAGEEPEEDEDRSSDIGPTTTASQSTAPSVCAISTPGTCTRFAPAARDVQMVTATHGATQFANRSNHASIHLGAVGSIGCTCMYY